MTTLCENLDITTGLAAVLRPKKRRYPQHCNRISALDDVCLRRLYYMRAAWDKAAETDDGLQGVFETGNLLEPLIEGIARDVGLASAPRWRIVGNQMPTNDSLLKKYQISGTIDGLLQIEVDGQWVTQGVVDIKTMSPHLYDGLTDYGSLAKYPWTRRYRGQLMLYALAHNLERCFLLLVNKTNLYAMKFLEFRVDLDYCEALLQKAEAVNTAIAASEPPAGVNDPAECKRCAWLSFCAPDLKTGGNLEILINDELEQILDRLAELEPTTDEASELESRRDALLVKGKDVAVGHWMVTWKQTVVRRKAQEASESVSWRKTITRL